MAETDITNPMISSFFWPDQASGLTYEQLKARRAIAAQLAAKGRDYPNTIGKGIFSAAESITEGVKDRRLDAEEKKLRAGDAEELKKLRELNPSYNPIPVPPVGPPGPAAAPPPGSTGPTAALAPEVDASRAQLTAAAMPTMTRMAALNPSGTMSDAGPPGLTYGGPQPAGPGASMAEPPDQAPPAPSAPPPMQAPPPGQADTPPPAAGTGGGVPQMAGGLPNPMGNAGPGVSRDALAQTAVANQAANPDAPGRVPSGVPPQMLAQVGGFGGGSGGPSPPPPAGGAARPGTGGAMPALPGSEVAAPAPPGGVRPGASPDFLPMSEEEAIRRVGPLGKPPQQWDPDLYGRYRKAVEMSQNPMRSPEFRKQAADTADVIEKANKERYNQGQERHKSQEAQRQSQINEINKRLWDQQKLNDDPIEQGKRRTAAREERLATKSGLPAERLYKQMDAELESAKVTASKQEDNKIIRDALRSGLPITGAWAEPKLDMARYGAWVTQNPQLAARAGSTELLRAKLLGGVSAAISDLKPVSNFEVQLGQKMVGDISQQPEVLKALVDQSIQRNNRSLMRYDQRAHRFFSGEGEIAQTYESPNAAWMRPDHVQMLVEGTRNPANRAAEMAEFDSRYGPGSAEFALHRHGLRSSRGP